MKKVGIVMGSDSDLPVVRKAADTLEALHIPYEMHIFAVPIHEVLYHIKYRNTSAARRIGFCEVIVCRSMW